MDRSRQALCPSTSRLSTIMHYHLPCSQHPETGSPRSPRFPTSPGNIPARLNMAPRNTDFHSAPPESCQDTTANIFPIIPTHGNIHPTSDLHSSHSILYFRPPLCLISSSPWKFTRVIAKTYLPDGSRVSPTFSREISSPSPLPTFSPSSLFLTSPHTLVTFP